MSQPHAVVRGSHSVEVAPSREEKGALVKRLRTTLSVAIAVGLVLGSTLGVAAEDDSMEPAHVSGTGPYPTETAKFPRAE